MRAAWDVKITPRATRQLRKLPVSLLLDVREIIDTLKEDPFPEGAVQLRGWNDRYRIRLNGHRLVYRVNLRRKTILIFRVAHRSVVYEGLDR